jgi:hypothetical protein
MITPITIHPVTVCLTLAIAINMAFCTLDAPDKLYYINIIRFWVKCVLDPAFLQQLYFKAKPHKNLNSSGFFHCRHFVFADNTICRNRSDLGSVYQDFFTT